MNQHPKFIYKHVSPEKEAENRHQEIVNAIKEVNQSVNGLRDVLERIRIFLVEGEVI